MVPRRAAQRSDASQNEGCLAERRHWKQMALLH